MRVGRRLAQSVLKAGVLVLVLGSAGVYWWQIDNVSGGLETLVPGTPVGVTAIAGVVLLFVGLMLLIWATPKPPDPER